MTLYLPLDGLAQTLWLDGYYSQVITYLKTHAKVKYPRGRVESIRLVIAGKTQNRAIDASNAVWETYMVEAFPEEALQYIDGFILRISNKK